MDTPGLAAIQAMHVPLFTFFISVARRADVITALEYLSNANIRELTAENIFRIAIHCPWANAVVRDMYSNYMSGGDTGLSSIDNHMHDIKAASFASNIDKNTARYITLTRVAYFACSPKNTLLPVDSRIITLANESNDCITSERCDAMDILIGLPKGTSCQTFALHGVEVE
jgi:hypothetical protein